MKENINFINKIKISITSIKGYKELLKEKLSKVIIYSILLSLIVGVIQGILSFATISSIQKSVESVISSDEFKFTLEDGILYFENSPIKREEGRTLVYIDTNIDLDNVESIRKIVIHKDLSMAILKDGISYRIDGDKYEFKFSDIPIIDKVDNETVLKSLDLIGIVKYIVFITVIIGTYLNYMINSLILSVLGIVLNNINKLGLSYKTIFKICIYSMTLPMILGLILPIGSFPFLIAVIYLILVINYLKREIQV